MESPPLYEHTPPIESHGVLGTCRPESRCFNNRFAPLWRKHPVGGTPAEG